MYIINLRTGLIQTSDTKTKLALKINQNIESKCDLTKLEAYDLVGHYLPKE